MWYEWFFDGIGSTIVSLIAGAIIGGFTGYKIGIHKKIKLIQQNFSAPGFSGWPYKDINYE